MLIGRARDMYACGLIKVRIARCPGVAKSTIRNWCPHDRRRKVRWDEVCWQLRGEQDGWRTCVGRLGSARRVSRGCSVAQAAQFHHLANPVDG